MSRLVPHLPRAESRRKSKYETIKLVGKGSFGKCYLVKDVSQVAGNNARGGGDNKNIPRFGASESSSSAAPLFIQKCVDLSRMTAKQQKETLNEVEVLKDLRHPYIIRYRESFIENNTLCLVMDYAEKGDLYKRIQEQQATARSFQERRILKWFTQICLAVKYLHDKKILHRDLKTQNIFLTRKDAVRLGDFGIARVLQHTCDCARTAIGTPFYMSPEICTGQPYDFKSDVWSLGCVLYEMTTLRHAFNDESMRGLMMKILRGQYPRVSAKFSREIRKMIDETLSHDALKRPTVGELLNRKILRENIYLLLKEEEQEKPENGSILGKQDTLVNSSHHPSNSGNSSHQHGHNRPDSRNTSYQHVETKNRRTSPSSNRISPSSNRQPEKPSVESSRTSNPSVRNNLISANNIGPTNIPKESRHEPIRRDQENYIRDYNREGDSRDNNDRSRPLNDKSVIKQPNRPFAVPKPSMDLKPNAVDAFMRPSSIDARAITEAKVGIDGRSNIERRPSFEGHSGIIQANVNRIQNVLKPSIDKLVSNSPQFPSSFGIDPPKGIQLPSAPNSSLIGNFRASQYSHGHNKNPIPLPSDNVDLGRNNPWKPKRPESARIESSTNLVRPTAPTRPESARRSSVYHRELPVPSQPARLGPYAGPHIDSTAQERRRKLAEYKVASEMGAASAIQAESAMQAASEMLEKKIQGEEAPICRFREIRKSNFHRYQPNVIDGKVILSRSPSVDEKEAEKSDEKVQETVDSNVQEKAKNILHHEMVRQERAHDEISKGSAETKPAHKVTQEVARSIWTSIADSKLANSPPEIDFQIFAREQIREIRKRIHGKHVVGEDDIGETGGTSSKLVDICDEDNDTPNSVPAVGGKNTSAAGDEADTAAAGGTGAGMLEHRAADIGSDESPEGGTYTLSDCGSASKLKRDVQKESGSTFILSPSEDSDVEILSKPVELQEKGSTGIKPISEEKDEPNVLETTGGIKLMRSQHIGYDVEVVLFEDQPTEKLGTPRVEAGGVPKHKPYSPEKYSSLSPKKKDGESSPDVKTTLREALKTLDMEFKVIDTKDVKEELAKQEKQRSIIDPKKRDETSDAASSENSLKESEKGEPEVYDVTNAGKSDEKTEKSHITPTKDGIPNAEHDAQVLSALQRKYMNDLADPYSPVSLATGHLKFLQPNTKQTLVLPYQSRKDTIHYRLEMLKDYLEQEIGLEEFVRVYKLLDAGVGVEETEHANADKGGVQEYKEFDNLSKKTLSFMPLIHQLLCCEDRYYKMVNREVRK